MLRHPRMHSFAVCGAPSRLTSRLQPPSPARGLYRDVHVYARAGVLWTLPRHARLSKLVGCSPVDGAQSEADLEAGRENVSAGQGVQEVAPKLGLNVLAGQACSQT